MRYAEDILTSNCGLSVLYDFGAAFGTNDIDSIKQEPKSGTGFFIAGFIDTEKCREAYEELCAKTTLVYQSPVRVNRNSGNEYFFCVFDFGEYEYEEEDDF